jgi:hypothetical protein
MSLHLTHGMGWFLAGLMLGAAVSAQGQTNGLGQQIVFSTPEGQIVSNTAVPVAQAPQPQELEDMPVEAPVSDFNPHLPQAPFGTPLPMMMPQQRVERPMQMDPLDPMNSRKTMALPTPAQIMGVQTVRQIFGLPDTSALDILKNPALAKNIGSTNIISSGESSSEDPTWAKILADNSDQKTPDSSKTSKSHGLLDGFFNGPPSDDGFFGSQDKNAVANGYGSSPADDASGQSLPFDSSLERSTPASSIPTPSVPDTTANSGLSTPSPFALPQSSGLETLPQLPTAPSLPGQSYYSAPPAPPAWEPKPAPWLSPVPPAGTMEPRKF